MPELNKNFKLEITPEQFLNACSDTELQEIDLLLNRTEYQEKMGRNYRNSDNSGISDKLKMYMAESDPAPSYPIGYFPNKKLLIGADLVKVENLFGANKDEALNVMIDMSVNSSLPMNEIPELMRYFQKLERLRMKNLVSSPQIIPGNSDNSERYES